MNDDPRRAPASTGGKYAEWVSLLREDSAYLRTAAAPAYWTLAPYYVGQYTECACSLASAVMVVNAARAGHARSAGAKLVTQQGLLDRLDSAEWRTGVGQDDGKGVGLLRLAKLLTGSLTAAGAGPAEIEAVPLPQGTADDLARLRQVLVEGETIPGLLVIANFYMAAVIGEGDYGHFSPIGAFDPHRDRVLILDVYRVELEPYWVPLRRLFEGMATVSQTDGEARGYLTIRLSERR
ncbi:MAG: phytochelatin synthase family protein [Dongiaceae bacterium]